MAESEFGRCTDAEGDSTATAASMERVQVWRHVVSYLSNEHGPSGDRLCLHRREKSFCEHSAFGSEAKLRRKLKGVCGGCKAIELCGLCKTHSLPDSSALISAQALLDLGDDTRPIFCSACDLERAAISHPEGDEMTVPLCPLNAPVAPIQDVPQWQAISALLAPRPDKHDPIGGQGDFLERKTTSEDRHVKQDNGDRADAPQQQLFRHRIVSYGHQAGDQDRDHEDDQRKREPDRRCVERDVSDAGGRNRVAGRLGFGWEASREIHGGGRIARIVILLCLHRGPAKSVHSVHQTHSLVVAFMEDRDHPSSPTHDIAIDLFCEMLDFGVQSGSHAASARKLQMPLQSMTRF